MSNVSTLPTKTHQGYTDQEKEIIKKNVMQGKGSQEDLDFLLATAQRTGLDILARQIFPVFRWDSSKGVNVMQIQTSIDGFRLIAERSGKYEGQDGPYWCGQDGVWKDIWLDKAPPMAAKVGVYKTGARAATYAVARFDAYKQTFKDKQSGSQVLNSIWSKMGDMMNAKCAESLALRKAFPQELSGLYTAEEMGQAEEVPEGESQPATQPATSTKTTRSRQTKPEAPEASPAPATSVPSAPTASSGPTAGVAVAPAVAPKVTPTSPVSAGPAAPSPTTPPSSDPGDYVPTVGKFQTKPLRTANEVELADYVVKMIAHMRGENPPPWTREQAAKDFVERAQAWLNRAKPQAPAQPAQSVGSDGVPFFDPKEIPSHINSPAPSDPVDPGEFVFTFGKHTGRKVKDVPIDGDQFALRNYVEKLKHAQPAETYAPAAAAVQAFLLRVAGPAGVAETGL
jgi:phage recombination protein Bet